MTLITSARTYARLLGPCYKTGQSSPLCKINTTQIYLRGARTRTGCPESHPSPRTIMDAIKFLATCWRPPFCFRRRRRPLLENAGLQWRIVLVFLQLQALFTLLSKNFSPFLHITCSLSVFRFIFSFGRTLSPNFILYYQTVLLLDYVSYSTDQIRKGLAPAMAHAT
jgi:hypothetical protein